MDASGRLAKSTPGCWGVAQPDSGSGVAAGAGPGGLRGCADSRRNRVLQGSWELGGAGLQQRWEQELVIDAAGSGGGGDESPLRLNDTPCPHLGGGGRKGLGGVLVQEAPQPGLSPSGSKASGEGVSPSSPCLPVASPSPTSFPYGLPDLCDPPESLVGIFNKSQSPGSSNQ